MRSLPGAVSIRRVSSGVCGTGRGRPDFGSRLPFETGSRPGPQFGLEKEVPIEEAGRFGIFEVDENKKILNFEEKPAEPKSNLASMGIYIFNTDVLLEYLEN